MVYCGKASQGCKNCRTRRIKCDKVRPDCSQCIRVGKKCPGYRDQLSLMFRDESTKVIQKAHAQWGVSENGEGSSRTRLEPGAEGEEAGPSSGSSSGRSSSSTTPSPTSTDSPPGSVWNNENPIPIIVKREWQPSADLITALTKVPKEIMATQADLGVQFYIQHYLVGHPHEAKNLDELQGSRWLLRPNVYDMMASIGLACLANLRGQKEINQVARQKYGAALTHTAKALHNLGPNPDDMHALMRSVVMLAMFEVVRGNQEPTGSARTHIMGAAALVKQLEPWTDRNEWIRGILQLCFSMVPSVLLSLQLRSAEPNVLIPTQFVPCFVSGIGLPDTYFDMIATAEQAALQVPTQEDVPATELIAVVTHFVQLSALVRSHALTDAKPRTEKVVRDLLGLAADLQAWETKMNARAVENPNDPWAWRVVHQDPDDPILRPLPAGGVFRNRYHAYSTMWTARVWNHYRWARVLVDQMLLEAVERFPLSAGPLVTSAQRLNCLDAIRRVAKDTLTSVPTHWRHPALTEEERDRIEGAIRGVGIGAAGIPTLLFQIKCAACAPGVPYDMWEWAIGLLDTVWKDTGMLQARALAEMARKHGEALRRGETFDQALLKVDPGTCRF